MNSLIEQFKNNILQLKSVDDRIVNDLVISFDTLEGTNISKWGYLCNIYNTIYTNLKKDIQILENVANDISQYNNLGVQLGNAIETIYTQKSDIEQSIISSTQELDQIIHTIKQECGKITNN